MSAHRFDPAKMDKLDDPARLDDLRPDVMWAAFALRDARVLVEIGAGTGLISAAISAFAPGATVYAADIAPEMVLRMRERLSRTTLERVVPVLCGETSVPLPDGIADGVFLVNLHHELDHPVAVLREAFRLLQPGGRLLAVNWKKQKTPHGPPVETRIPLSDIEADVIAAGFAGVEHHDALSYHEVVTAGRP